MLKNKRRKLECEINRLLIFDNCDGRYSVYTSRGYCLLADTCLEFAKNFAHNFTRYIAYPLSENSKKYLSQYIELSDKTVLAIGKHAMRKNHRTFLLLRSQPDQAHIYQLLFLRTL